MTILTPEGYEQTKVKLARTEDRLAQLQNRDDLSFLHREEARQSYLQLIRQLKKEIKLFETSQVVTGSSGE